MDEKRKKQFIKQESKVNQRLYQVCGFITVLVMIMSLIEFFTRGLFPPLRVDLFYLGILSIYAFHKEIIRWLGEKHVEKQGEYFVYGWLFLVLLLHIINFFTKDYFLYSPQGEFLPTLDDISILTLEVIAIFVLTRILKFLQFIKIKRQGPVV